MPPDAPRPHWPWSEADYIRLRHMLEAADEITAFVAVRTRDSLRHGDISSLGLVKAVEIIGEAAFSLDPAVRAEIPDIPWTKIIAMRHRLVHAYFNIDLDIVWATATRAIPELQSALNAFLSGWDGPDLP